MDDARHQPRGCIRRSNGEDQGSRGLTRVLFVGGLSGAGKTFSTAASGLPILPLDSFYKAQDEPSLPRRFGAIDWEHPQSYDLEGAIDTVRALAAGETVRIPVYDHVTSAPLGSASIRASRLLIAEGVYAPDVFAATQDCLAPGTVLMVLTAGRIREFHTRIRRDVKERGRRPLQALVRSTRLLLRHGTYLREARLRGAVRVSREELVAICSAGGSREEFSLEARHETPCRTHR
jgi:uridine kinase